MFTQLFAAAFVAVAAQSALAADACSRSYTIKDGDYCDKISQANNVSTFQLAAVNSGSINDDCTNLQIGADLCLGHSGEDCTTTYVVKAGDSCSGIASGAGLNTTILYLNNPQIDEACQNIYIGEVLCISKTVQVPPIPATGVVVPVSGPPANPPPAGKPAADPPKAITVTPTASGTPAAPAAAAPTPAPATNDDNNDDDCDDDATDGANGADGANGGADDDNDDDLPFCDEI